MIGVAGSAPVAISRRGEGVGATRRHNAGQCFHGLMLEHRARRNHQPGLARPAHQLDRHDAVAAEREEVVVDPDTLETKHLRKQGAQDLLLRRARRPPHRSHRCSGAGSARRSSLPLGVSGSRSSTTNADGTMCSGRLCPRCARSTAASGTAARRRHNIANQPLAPGPVLARNHRRLRNIPHAPPAPPRSRPARSGTRAPSPAHPHAPGTPAPRRRASAPGRRCGTSGSPQHQTGPQQTAPPSDPHAPHSHAQDQTPQCKAPRSTPAGTGSRPPSKT